MTPKVSLVLPINGTERDLNRIIESIGAQTRTDYEVILVPFGSAHIPESAAAAVSADSRFRIADACARNLGDAWNRGLECARGEYVVFCRSCNLYEPDFLQKVVQRADMAEADIVAFHFRVTDEKGRSAKKSGIHTQWLPEGCEVFNYRQCPLNILRITTPGVHNKLYRKVFLLERGIRFPALDHCSGASFMALSQGWAERIAYEPEYLAAWPLKTEWEPGSLDDFRCELAGIAEQLRGLPHWEEITDAADKFLVEQCLEGLKQGITDFSAEEAARFYTFVHELFSGPMKGLTPERINNRDLYRQYQSVRKHDYGTMRKMTERRLIVSLTTYPGRIHLIPQVLETIFNQTRKADAVVLWLAREQFPDGESALPEQLRILVAEKKLDLRWCDDLKAHKKYFYALQEFRQDLVVTVDDDLKYPADMLSCLYASYLLYPEAVSTVRAHLMMFGEEKEILPYGSWIQETDSLLHTPSMQLLATGGAGALYPPELFRQEFFDAGAIRENCLWADDLWLKAMEAVSGVPVVLARKFEPLRYMPDSQSEGLVVYNVQNRQNDVQMANIIRWTDSVFAPGILREKLTEPVQGTLLLGLEPVAAHLDRERKNVRWQYLQTCGQLARAKEDLSRAEKANRKKEQEFLVTHEELLGKRRMLEEANQQIGRLGRRLEAQSAEISSLGGQLIRWKKQNEQTEERLRLMQRQREEAEQALQNTRTQLQQTNSRLTRTEELLRQEKENAPIGRQLKAIGTELARKRKEGLGGLGLAFKYLLYGLAWIPEKILAGTMFYLKNGGKETLKKILRRVRRG